MDIFNTLPASQSLDLLTILFNVALAFGLAVIIAAVYQKTHRGLSYSQSFVISLVILCILAAVIMMVIGNVIVRAVALLGAFTIIRFRTAVKDTKDITFILFALIVGMAAGTLNYLIAMVSTIFISLVVFFLDKINFGSTRRYDYVLSFAADRNRVLPENYETIMRKYLKKYELLNMGVRQAENLLEVTFSLHMASGMNPRTFIEELNSLDGLSDVQLIRAKNDVEY